MRRLAWALAAVACLAMLGAPVGGDRVAALAAGSAGIGLLLGWLLWGAR